MTPKKSELRVGVIGIGMGRGHVKNFQKHPSCRVVAIADVDKQRLKERGDELGVATRYTTGEEMLAKETLDIACVATPNKFHKPLTIAALEAGCHVLCEKPMAMNTAEARDMLDAARKAGRRLMINFSSRFNPFSQALKRQVDRGVLGDVYYARTCWLRRRGMPGFGGWFGQKALAGGGPLIDLGVHRLDLALWLMGYPKPEWVIGSVYDHIASRHARASGKVFDVEDLATAYIRFENGASLTLEASWAGHIKEAEFMETRLLGTKAGLVQRNVGGGYTMTAEVYTEEDGVQYDISPSEPLDGPQSTMGHFADCILEDRPHTATGEEGLVVMELLDAIYESAAKGEPIRVVPG
jgi:predicted dehydrogenase